VRGAYYPPSCRAMAPAEDAGSVYADKSDDTSSSRGRDQQLEPSDGGEEAALLGAADDNDAATDQQVGGSASCLQQYASAVCTDRVFGLFLLVMALNGVLIGPFLPFVPVYVDEVLHAPQTTTATLRTLGLLGMAICVFAGGIVTDTFGPKVSLLLGLLATPTAGLLFMMGGGDAGANDVATVQIGALAFVQGGLNGIMDGAGMATLVTAAPEGSIGAATALYFVSYTGAQALGNAGAGLYVTEHGFASMGRVMAAGAVPVLLLAMAVLPSGQAVNQQAASKEGSTSSYWDVVRRKPIWSLCLLNFLRTVFWGAATLALPFMINALADKVAVGVYSAVSLGAAMAMMLGVGAISDGFDRRVISTVCILSLLAISLLLAAAAQLASVELMYAGGTLATAVAWTFSGQIDGPLAKAAVAGHPGSEGRMFGCMQSAWATAMLCGAQCHGMFTEEDAPAMFVGLAVLFVPCVLLLSCVFGNASAGRR
jgi:MFS family permease